MPKWARDGIKNVAVRVNDPHGGRAVASGTLDVDGSRPVLSGLRVAARVLGVPMPGTRARRHARASGSPPRATTVRFRLSEAASLTLAVDRARKPRRGKRWVRARTIKRSLRAGKHGITVRARGLKPGRYRMVLSAADEVGNRSPRRTLGLRVVRLPR